MQKNNVQLGEPIALYTDTKANIEAIAEVVEGMIAYATDTNTYGTYNGVSWDWGATTLSDHDHSGDVGDGGTFDATNLTSGTSTDGQVLTSDGAGGAAWEDSAGGTLADHDHSGDAGDGGTFDAANLTSGASTDGQVLTSDGSGGAAWEDASNSGEGHLTILPLSYSSIGAGDWTMIRNESSWYDWYMSQATPANLDNISYKIYLAAGTYSFKLLYHINTTGGIMDIDIDSTEIGSVDQYGSLTWNQTYTVTGIVIATSGLKTLKLRMDGKNASSSSYKGWCLYMVLWRTA